MATPHSLPPSPRPAPTSDREAFQRVLERLERDVGIVLKMLEKAETKRAMARKRSKYPLRGITPFWSLARMFFPIAESIGDLIHKDASTSKNLMLLLEHECGGIEQGYKSLPEIIALLYRHSLTHTDELRVLQTKNLTLKWRISYNERTKHLKIERADPTTLRLQFDLSKFYDHLVQICKNQVQSPTNGEKNRYNNWLNLNLDISPPKSGPQKDTAKTRAAIAIQKLNASIP